MGTMVPKRKSARCLFGKPDHEALNKALKKETDAIYEMEKKKFNFDFKQQLPIHDGSGDYHFEAVPANEIPQFYHEKVLKPSKSASIGSLCTVYTCSEPSFNKVEQIPSTSKSTHYEKPVTRSATRLTILKKNQNILDEKGWKQTKLTSYMPIRKRRNEVVPKSLNRSQSAENLSIKDDINPASNSSKKHNKLVPNECQFSSYSDTRLVHSPRSPPAKKTLRRRKCGAGDF